ncbi:hypothetical protein SCTVLC_0238 [Serratia symbiotica SCt-VLC]|uniref:Uncharacterized protein n=1 Tax=Serratia symbiotica SCt-VLC TaxID=1347341 RepID=A0A068R8Y9_9GAMM|nr:hypothetical protein SCTVLC_0238 [Serratia symbiotica SCt-VLC]
MLIGAVADPLQADKTFPLQVATAVKRQTVRFDRLVDKRVQRIIDVLNGSAFGEALGYRKTHFLKLFYV